MKKVLITGGTGFVGSHLIDELLKKKKKIRCLALKEDLILGSINQKRITYFKSKGVEIFYGDLTRRETLAGLLKNIDEVYHIAAIARPMPLPRKEFYNVNFNGTKNLFYEILKQNKHYKNQIKKIVYVSSISVLGFSRDKKPLTESSPYLPVSIYGESKRDAEIFVLDFCRKNNLSCTILRPPMIYGPRDYQFLHLFKSINTGIFPLLRKGKAKMEFLYVKNFVQALILAMKKMKFKKVSLYNVTDGETYTTGIVFREIARQLNKSLIPFSKPLFKFIALFVSLPFKIAGKMPPFHPGTAEWMSEDNPVSCEKAKKEIGYKNIIPIKKAVHETILWYRKEGLL